MKTRKSIITLLLLPLLLCAAPAQTLTIKQGNGSITLSVDDTNHLYSIEQKANTLAGFEQAGTNTIGSSGTVTFKMTNAACFFRAVQMPPADGFLIYATPFAVTGGSVGECTGAYIGEAIYSQPAPGYIGWLTNGAAILRASDPNGNGNTRIVATSLNGSFACGQSPLNIAPDESEFIFTVYFRTNIPTGPYPLMIQGFEPQASE